MIFSLLFACSDSVIIHTAPQTWPEENIDSAHILLRRQDELLDRIQYRGIPLIITRDIDTLNIQEVEVPEDVNIFTLIAELNQTGEYEFVEPVIYRSIPKMRRVPLDIPLDQVRAPNDPFYFLQLNMDNVQATDLSGVSQGAGITVAVIDSGVATAGTDTPVNMLAGYDFHNSDNDATDDNGHGTHVAGTIAQASNNGIGTMGITPNVNILPIKVLGADGTGFSTNTIEGTNYAVQQGADVINLSLGSPNYSAAEEAAVNAAVNANVAVIGATGNDGIKNGGVYYPAAYTNAIAVTATDLLGVSTGYSNTGPEVDLAAPGGDVSADADGDGNPDGILQETLNSSNQWNFYFFEGTSMATPHVSGAFAALMANGASALEAEVFILSSAIDLGTAGFDSDYGNGEIRIQDAIDAYLSSPPSSSLDGLSVGDLVITEFMADPSQVDDWKGEWIEVYNTTANDLNLNGLVFSGSEDLGFTVTSDVTILANDYALFSVNSSPGGNAGIYGVDYEYDYNNLKLYNADSLDISYDGTTFDSISWDQSYGLNTGEALGTRSLSASANDLLTDWCSSSTSYGLGDFGTPGTVNDCTSIVSVSAASPGDLVISEVMTDPSLVSDFRGEWFEIYNNTANAINLNGLIVSSAGQSGFTLSSDLLIEPSNYAVFASRDDSSNGGISVVNYAYGYSNLKLYYTDSITISNSSSSLDSFTYNSTSFPILSGKSMEVSSLDATDNNSPIYWNLATSTYGDGDFGTPGADNAFHDSAPLALTTLGIGDLIISEIMLNPAQTTQWRGEWFEIYNNTANTVNLNGLIVSSAGQSGFTLSSDLSIGAGEYVVFANRLQSSLNGNLPIVDSVYSYAKLKFYHYDSLVIGSTTTPTIDQVVYDMSWPHEEGKSLSLSTLDATSNDDSSNWCVPTSTYGNGDFGTPASGNDSCE